MLRKQQLAVDSLVRVQAFRDTHASVLGPLKDTDAGKQLDAAIDAANTQALTQRGAERTLDAKATSVEQLVQSLKVDHMTPFAKFARANLRGAPDFSALTKVSHNLRGRALVRDARSMATAAASSADTLTKAQFPADAVQQLSATADALEGALVARDAARSARVVATAGVRDQLAKGREAVAMLDPIVTKKLVGQKDLLAGWRSAKRMTLAPGSGAAAAPVVPVAVPSTSAKGAAAQEVKAVA